MLYRYYVLFICVENVHLQPIHYGDKIYQAGVYGDYVFYQNQIIFNWLSLEILNV